MGSTRPVCLILFCLATLSGCKSIDTSSAVRPSCKSNECQADQPCNIQLVSSTTVEDPCLTCPGDSHQAALASCAPRSLKTESPANYRDITLTDVIAIGLLNSKVLKDLGGRVLTSPDTIATVYDPAITEADPLYGVEGALSAFDTQFANSLLFQQNDRSVNNITLGGGTRDIQQQIANYSIELNKTTATGSRFALRNTTIYDASNQPGNLFPSAYDSLFEIEARQPLMQGAGVEFNRIAGPNAQPGFNFSSGVLVARTNTDIEIAKFETGVRDFVSQLEEAYWELYFAYRNLDAWRTARDAARRTWEDIRAQEGLPGGTAEREARARVQYFLFQNLVQDALNGNPREGRSVGVYRGERRLRMLMGMPNNDGDLLRPLDEPRHFKVQYNWDQALAQALAHRSEIRRQRWVIKRAELELTAAKNFLKPRLDLVALGRMRGFGDTLAGTRSALRDVRTGDHPEWQVGAEFTMPVGFRRAHAGVRQAQLKLLRGQAVLREQELLVAHNLGDAISEVDRAHVAIETNYNRLNAAQERLTAAQAVYEVDKVSIDLVLDAQQELSQSLAAYFDALSDYEIAKKEVYAQSGTLLAHRGIHLNEGPWSQYAHCDAIEEQSRLKPSPPRKRCNVPGFISAGVSPQLDPVETIMPQESAAGPAGSLLPLPQTELPTPQSQVAPPMTETPSSQSGADRTRATHGGGARISRLPPAVVPVDEFLQN